MQLLEPVEFEEQLAAARCASPVEAAEGFPLPSGRTRKLLWVGDVQTGAWGGVAEYASSRIAPWRTILRILRAPGVESPVTGDRVSAGILQVAHAAKALRTHVELYEPDDARRALMKSSLLKAGFHEAQSPRRYSRTIRVDLSLTEDQLLGSFHATCRRHLRSFGRKGLQCLPVVNADLETRLQQLLDETMRRTGGASMMHDWRALMRFTRESPHRAILLGAFRSDLAGPESLVGYVLGVRHSDTVEYSVAASTRLDDLKVPLLYAPTWELIRWARSNGAAWFDFGGVLPPSVPADDPRQGISSFKRMFSTAEIDVGGEFVMDASDNVARAVKFARRILD